MTTPRVEIDLAKIEDNTRSLVGLLAPLGIDVTAVTKAALGCPAVAAAMLRGGATGLGDARMENVQRLRRAGIDAEITLLRSPMPGDVAQVVELVDVSLNTELTVLAQLSAEAERRDLVHGVLLMVELGDLREGVMGDDLPDLIRACRTLRGVEVIGLGANLACRSGVVPDATNMHDLDDMVATTESLLGRPVAVVSGGNSATLAWALAGGSTGRVTSLRLGEAILLGLDPLDRQPIRGLHTDAFSVVAAVIESAIKPSLPWGAVAQSAFGPAETPVDRGRVAQSILALGRQDTDPAGLTPHDQDVEVLAASSDHLVIRAPHVLPIGTEVSFRPAYGALSRAMASPFLTTTFVGEGGEVAHLRPPDATRPRPSAPRRAG